VLPLVWYEVKGNLRPTKVLPLLGLCIALFYPDLHEPWSSDDAQLQGALVWHGDWLWPMVPLIAGAVGSSLADERRKGITLTFLSRGVTRSECLRSKILGSAASGALITTAAILCFYIVVGIMWPWGRVQTQGTEWAPGPMPSLYAVNPLANDMLAAAMSIAAGAALPAVSVLAGTLTSNRYIALVSPMLLVIGGGVFKRNRFDLINLTIYLTWSTVSESVPTRLLPYATFVYWPCFAMVLAGLCQWIFAKRELS